MRIQIDVAVDFFYGGRDSYLVRRAECEFRVQRCRISSQQTNRTIVVQYVVHDMYVLRSYICSMHMHTTRVREYTHTLTSCCTTYILASTYMM